MVILGALCLVLALAFLLVTADEGEGATLVVSGGDDTYDYIQEAIDDAKDGDTIRVFEGHYIENVVVDKRVDIIGNGSEHTTIYGAYTGHAMELTADNILVVGIHFQVGYSRTYDGMVVRSNFNVISENRFSSGVNGLWLENSTNNLMLNNIFGYNTESGIALVWSHHNTISFNQVQEDIVLHRSDHNTISNNDMSEYSSVSIHLESSDNNTIRNNTFIMSYSTTISLTDSNYNKIIDNTITSSYSSRILVENSRANHLSNNNISSGMRVYNSSRIEITDNEIGGEVNLDVSTLVTITGNQYSGTAKYHGLSINGDRLEHWDSHVIDSNHINGRPILFLANESDLEVKSDSAQVILFNCSNITLKGLSMNYLSMPIQVAFSSNLTIYDNDLSDNNIALSVYNSISINFTDNNCSGNLVALSAHDSAGIDFNYNNCSGGDLYLYNLTGSTISGNFLAGGVNNGIHLENSRKVKIIDNDLSDMNLGVYMLNSHENLIANNTLNINHMYCFYLSGSDNNTLRANRCISTYFAISLLYSDHNTITENNLTKSTTNTYKGNIYLKSSSSNKISNNSMYGGSISFFSTIYDYDFYQMTEDLSSNDIGTNNTVNDRPIFVIKELSDVTVPRNVATVIALNCTNVTILEGDYRNVTMGLLLISSSWVNISDIDGSNNSYGAIIIDSSNVTVTNSRFDENEEYGMIVSDSDDIRFINSTSCLNHRGIISYLSHNLALVDVNISDNQYDNAHFYSSDFIGIMNSSFNNGHSSGIQLYESDIFRIENSSASGNHYGIRLSYADGGHISNTILNDNTRGIQLYNSDDNTIRDNNCSDNEFGIYVERSDDMVIVGNTLFSNTNIGFRILNSHGGVIKGNRCDGEQNYCMYMEHSEYNTISLNHFQHSGKDNIQLRFSEGNSISHNNLSHADIGINIKHSDDILITNNTLWNNSQAIVYTSSSDNVTILNNSINIPIIIPTKDNDDEPTLDPADKDDGNSTPALLILALAALFVVSALVAGQEREMRLDREKKARLEARRQELEQKRQEAELKRSMIYESTLKDHGRWRPGNGKQQ